MLQCQGPRVDSMLQTRLFTLGEEQDRGRMVATRGYQSSIGGRSASLRSDSRGDPHPTY